MLTGELSLQVEFKCRVLQDYLILCPCDNKEKSAFRQQLHGPLDKAEQHELVLIMWYLNAHIRRDKKDMTTGWAYMGGATGIKEKPF